MSLSTPGAEDLIARYGWVTDYADTVGCLLSSANIDESTLAGSYGADRARRVSIYDETNRYPVITTFAQTDSDVCVLERNNHQGSRAEVLVPASRGRVAASVFWDLDGTVLFKQRVVAS